MYYLLCQSTFCWVTNLDEVVATIIILAATGAITIGKANTKVSATESTPQASAFGVGAGAASVNWILCYC